MKELRFKNTNKKFDFSTVSNSVMLTVSYLGYHIGIGNNRFSKYNEYPPVRLPALL